MNVWPATQNLTPRIRSGFDMFWMSILSALISGVAAGLLVGAVMLYLNNTKERKAKTIEKELTKTTHQLFEQINDQLNFVLDKAIKDQIKDEELPDDLRSALESLATMRLAMAEALTEASEIGDSEAAYRNISLIYFNFQLMALWMLQSTSIRTVQGLTGLLMLGNLATENFISKDEHKERNSGLNREQSRERNRGNIK